MTRLILLRHGETLSNIEMRYQGQGNSQLSELGLKEAGLLAQALKSEELDGIYGSSLKRSLTTADIIAKAQGKNAQAIDDLKERYYGEWEDLTFDEIKDKWPELYQTWLLHPHLAQIPGAETLDQLQKRGVTAVEKLVKKHSGKSLAVVGHGGINRTILFHYMNLTLDNFWRIRQDNCCVNIIDFTERHPRLTLLNSTWFLGEKRLKRQVY